MGDSGKRAPAFFVSHGAGPFAVLGAEHQLPLVELFKKTRWVLDGCNGVILPELYYDYIKENEGELPKEAWEIKYSAKGDPDLAKRIKERFDDAGYVAVLDEKRGWDHGTWVPMILLRTEGDLSCIQVSIPQTSNTTEDCIKYGRILASFRDEGYCILGSVPNNRPFEDELEGVATQLKGQERINAALHWRDTFPDHDVVQPVGKDEHFMPFIVSIGAAGADQGKKLGEWDLFGTTMTSYVW
ncbi:hypothetical protein OIDMADRAFT_40838 [Oidiodendron maius Zn]|uniref:Extradiol ring-cleavage dioxygenase class III enzyme subunit B domain-containing protein n=1 Tax=Oidiodendron maius (strain Zn) TaxID=913774 RepID=A0A0C3CW86_OIDMZ|nr:hypothetical protein OIDMADRAFT_40838 [Oidiodendron maius Zn]